MSPEPSSPRSDGPRHVAVIMDGNGRWAAARGLPRAAGHREGVEALKRTIRAAPDLGIRCLTVFGFSTENWSRPADEVSDLTVTWSRLEILDRVGGGPGDDIGEVEFRAYHRAGVLHERSRFARRAGRWFYVDGDLFD